jgi:DNA-binding beta-propeller fold protein YncE
MQITRNRPILSLAVAGLVAVSASCCQPAASAQTIETIAGTGDSTNNGDHGRALKINIGDPFGVEYSPAGELHICEVRNHRVWLLDGKGELRVIAGSGKKGYAGDGGPATAAELNEPYEVRFDSAGNVLFVEMQNQIVRKVDRRTGKISTVAGCGKKGFGGDGGPATEALFSSPHSIALDSVDNIYIADIGNHRIRKVDAKTGLVSTIAGNGERQPPVEGQVATGKPMIGPRALFITGDTLWIALREGHSVWRMDLKSGVLSHVAGTGKRGYSGDGGLAKEAAFDGPKGIAIGPDKNIYVADTENNVIRRIDAMSGIITTIAGRGPKHKGAEGDGGPATAASMDRPHGICVAADGAVIIGDTLTNRVRRVR